MVKILSFNDHRHAHAAADAHAEVVPVPGARTACPLRRLDHRQVVERRVHRHVVHVRHRLLDGRETRNNFV